MLRNPCIGPGERLLEPWGKGEQISGSKVRLKCKVLALSAGKVRKATEGLGLGMAGYSELRVGRPGPGGKRQAGRATGAQ